MTDKKAPFEVPSIESIRDEGKLEAGKRGKTERAFASATFFIPRPTHKRLKEYATTHDTTLQQILETALNDWLISAGEPPFYPEGWKGFKKKDRLE